MTTHYPTPREDAPLVVFDFDHTLYDGDSGTHLFASLIKRNPLRMLAALLVTPIAGPMVAMLPTRRAGISVYVWIGSFGLHRARDFNKVIDAYVLRNQAQMRASCCRRRWKCSPRTAPKAIAWWLPPARRRSWPARSWPSWPIRMCR